MLYNYLTRHKLSIECPVVEYSNQYLMYKHKDVKNLNIINRITDKIWKLKRRNFDNNKI